MNRASQMALAVVLALGAIGVAVWAVFFRKQAPVAKAGNSSAATAAKPGPGGCSPDFVDQQTKTLLESSTASGAQGAQAGGPYAGAGAAAASAAPIVAGLLSGPCGAQIEKKLREELARMDPNIGPRADALLKHWDKVRLDALKTNPITRGVKSITAPVNTAKGIVNKIGGAGTVKKISKKLGF
jgi:hypothetical protein